MQPLLKTTTEKKLIGKRMSMSLADIKTGQLWGSLMPRRMEIQNRVGTELYSLQVMPPGYFEHFDPAATFEKWALVEVTDFDTVPSEMETFTLPSGLYAVFTHKGSGKDNSIFQYIFQSWLPQSEYVLDNRPHFEILGEKYKNEDASSEEEIWIPVRKRQVVGDEL